MDQERQLIDSPVEGEALVIHENGAEAALINEVCQSAGLAVTWISSEPDGARMIPRLKSDIVFVPSKPLSFDRDAVRLNALEMSLAAVPPPVVIALAVGNGPRPTNRGVLLSLPTPLNRDSVTHAVAVAVRELQSRQRSSAERREADRLQNFSMVEGSPREKTAIGEPPRLAPELIRRDEPSPAPFSIPPSVETFPAAPAEYRSRRDPPTVQPIGEVVKALLWIAAALIGLTYMMAKGMETYRVMRASGETFAQVAETWEDIVDNEIGPNGYVTFARYRFTVGDESFEGIVQRSHGELKVGDRIQVQFNAQNPEENRERGNRRVVSDFLVTLLFVGIISYFAIASNWSTLRTALLRRVKER